MLIYIVITESDMLIDYLLVGFVILNALVVLTIYTDE
jgi:hypothetical protein